MAKDMRMLEMNSVGIVDENVEENELMLELSIGGIFGKSNRNGGESVEKEVQIQVPATATAEALNVQSKREIQAFRRRELRRKREEKLKKSVGFGSCGSVSGPFVENKEWLDEVLEIEPAHKKERIGNLPENIGTIPSAAAAFTNGFVNQNVMQVSGEGVGQVVGRIDESLNMKSCVFRPTACRSFRPYEGNRNVKAIEDEIEGGGGGRRNGNVNSSGGSGGCGSSVFSDSQCSSRHGGATDDSRSNSSNSQLDQLIPTTSIASDPSDQPTDSSKPSDSTVHEPGPLKPHDQLNPPEPSLPNPPSKLESATQQQQASFLARMPSVSTTGNGPNGKTVSGFLYRYTKNEVSIVCVCHGQSFSPAGFVEHAGGVDIVHPLKHITIFPTAFAS